MVISQFVANLKRKWMHLWIKPIRVFDFHQVSDVFEPENMWECDWTQTEVFKRNILTLKEKYTFISLEDAYRHISNDSIRFKKYAALTADDGWASQMNVLPWLAGQKIPVTLFLNPLYLDSDQHPEHGRGRLFTRKEVMALMNDHWPFITIASHGWLHEKCTRMNEEEFRENVQKAEDALSEMRGKVPFYAFSYGVYKDYQIDYVRSKSLVPVLLGNQKNYRSSYIYRECLDGGRIPE